MKKFISLLIAFFVLIICMPSNVAFAEESSAFVYTGSSEFDMDDFLKNFTNDYKDRTTSNYESEFAAAVFLGTQFKDLNLKTQNLSEAAEGKDFLKKFVFTSGNSQYSSNNVIAVKPATTESNLNVIIGAHYDNVYDYKYANPYTNLNNSTLSYGAYDNGSGVTVMMSIANNIKDYDFPFNVTFVAFGAEEKGMHGSQYYTQQMTKVQKENTLLMINLDSISAGDFVYLFSKDWKTGHDSYLRDNAKELNIPLRALPFDKKYTSDPFGSKLYSHLAYYSDNYYFLQENINTAFFMTMNWESKIKAGVVESDKNNDIMHTYNDNYSELKKLYPHTYLLYMQYVSELVTYSLKKDDFASAMTASKANAVDYSFIMNEKYLTVFAIVIWLGFAVFAYIYYGKLKKVSENSIKEYLSNPENVEKLNVIIKGFQYPPKTYKPKEGEDEFTVFGKEYEKKEDENGNDNDKNSTI